MTASCRVAYYIMYFHFEDETVFHPQRWKRHRCSQEHLR